MRKLKIAALGMLAAIGLSFDATASEISIAYAIEINDEITTGILSCDSEQMCFGPLGLVVTPPSPFKSRYEILLMGRTGCCLFADAQRSVSVSSQGGAAYLELFEGRVRAGNELIENIRVGTLGLVFQSKPDQK